MLRHIYMVFEHYEDHEGYVREFQQAFSNPVHANQYVNHKYETTRKVTRSNAVTYYLEDERRSVEIVLTKLDPDVRNCE